MKSILYGLLAALALFATVSDAVDINGELKRARAENLAADPTGAQGKFYFNTVSGRIKAYSDGVWYTLSTSEDVISDTLMDSAGDMIIGGASGVPTKLDSGTANYVLRSAGAAAPTWSLLTNDSIDASAAIAYSKLDLDDSIVATDISSSEVTGSGFVVLDTSPTLVTPTLGVASATSINKVAITAPASASTLTIADGKTLTASNTLTLTGTDSSSVDLGDGGTVVYETGAQTLTQKTLTSPITTGGSMTAVTTFSLRDSIEPSYSLRLLPSSAANMSADRTLTIDVGNGARTLGLRKSLTVTTGDVTFVGDAAGSNLTLPASGTLANRGNLSQFAATTSAQLAGVISDETGSGALALATSPTLVTPTLDDYILFNEESAPSTPASGKVAVYAKSDGKLYKKDDTGLEEGVGAGSGSGEINVVDNPNDANAGWTSSDTDDLTCETSSISSDLPLAGVSETAIKITPIADTAYCYYRWTMPAALENRKLKIEWHQKPLSGYATGDFKVEVYSNAASDYSGAYSEFSLSTDSSGTSSIPNQTGKYTTTFDADDDDYYELRIVRTAGTTALNIANVVVGPGIQPQGGVTTPWTYTNTPTILGGTSNPTKGTNSVDAIKWRRVGDAMELEYHYSQTVAGASGSGVYYFAIPGGLTAVTTGTQAGGVSSGQVGYASCFDGTNSYYGEAVLFNSTNITLGEVQSDASSRTSVGSARCPMGNASARYSISAVIPILEWAGSGTMSVIQDETLDEWSAFTPSWSNIGTLTFSTNEGYRRRVGDSLHIRAYLEVSGGTGAASSLVLTIPGSLNADTAKIAGYADLPSLTHIGSWAWYDDSGSATNLDDAHGWVAMNNATSILFRDPSNSGSLATDELATSDRVAIDAVIPILEWRGKSGGGPVGFAMADTTYAGLVSTGTQSIAGVKTFSDGVKLDDDASQTAFTYYREGSTSTTFTFNGSGGTSGSVTVYYTRSGNVVTLRIPTVSASAGTGSTALVSNTAIESWARPAAHINAFVGVTDNGSAQTLPGLAQVTTSGVINLYKTWTGATWTNSVSHSVGGGNSFTISYVVD